MADNCAATAVEGKCAAARWRRLLEKLETYMEEDILHFAMRTVGQTINLGRDRRRQDEQRSPGRRSLASSLLHDAR
ncbi:hypothetical protein L4923_25975 [Mesorhizobium sp. IRAMC:0171]|uniref:Uncharacterized protein n=1 Tax=Mesorhizobium retamae TaxID=2912854 RepID=A0ABS9QM18_9HYPH|nr:hypothetical protein [Mesorhizobium sp. IRAMC:0171]MCG7508493.1 hypothetical protein [Mesorhizobium sp. IRAMC:0171]